MCYISIWGGGGGIILPDANFDKRFNININISVLLTLSCFHLYLQLQVWVISHVNQQAVEGGHALRVSLTAGTPWMEVTHNKFTFIQHTRIQTERHKGRWPGRQPTVGLCAVMYVQYKKWIQVKI